MKAAAQRQLTQELNQAGASPTEVQSLLPIAASLSQLATRPATTAAGRVRRWPQAVRPVGWITVGVALGMFVVLISQAVLPSSWLFPIQKMSDSVAVSLHAPYRATVMMKRAQQVNQLVAAHASSHQILTTLADYSHQASAYKATADAHYAAFIYCQANLQQAASTASPSIRQAIAASLQSLETT